MQYLGSSQTFVGVIATIVVLCVLVGDGNFVYKILESIKVRLKEEIKNASVTPNFDAVAGLSSYKTVKMCAEGSSKSPQKVVDECLKSVSHIGIQRTFLQSDYIIPDLERPSSEQYLAPLYTFYFVLIMFVCDEFLRSDRIHCNDMIVTFLTCFTLFSVFYWMVKWCSFCSRHSSLKHDGKSQSTERCGEEKYGYFELLKHLFYLLSASFFVALIVYLLAENVDFVKSILFAYEDCFYLKLATIGFCVFNGLLLPFVLPFVGYKYLCHLARNEARCVQERADELIKKIKEDLEKLASEVIVE